MRPLSISTPMASTRKIISRGIKEIVEADIV